MGRPSTSSAQPVDGCLPLPKSSPALAKSPVRVIDTFHLQIEDPLQAVAGRRAGTLSPNREYSYRLLGGLIYEYRRQGSRGQG